MTAVAVLACVVACWAAAGLRLLRALAAEPQPAGERLHAGTAVGMVLCGGVGAGLAALGALRPIPLGLAGGAALALGAGPLWDTVRDLRVRLDGRSALVLAPAVVGLLIVLVSFATPPIGGDQTKYQLAYPRLFAQAGGLVPSSSVWGHQQFAQNFVYAVGYATGGEWLARVLAAVTEILAAMAFGLLLERHVLPGAGVLGAVTFFTLPISWSQMARAGVDTGVTLYALLAVNAVLNWWRTDHAGDLWRTALMAGCAGTCKVFGLLVPALVGLVVLGGLVCHHRGWGQALGRAVCYGVLVLCVCVPFYVRNVVDTGNPIYPFGASVLGGREWSPEAGAYLDLFFNQYQTRFAARREGMPYHGWEALRFPWDVTMYPESFEMSARQTLDLGPVALAFLPALLLVRRRRTAAWITAAVGAGFVTVITAAAWPHPRYVLPGVALCMVSALAGAQALFGRRGFVAVLGLTIVGNLALTTKLLTMWPDQVRVLTGRMSTPDFMRKYSSRWTFWDAANPIVGATGRVLVLEKIIHPYYIETPFLMASFLEQGWLDYRRVTTPEALAAIARARGITHIAVHVPALTAAGDPFEAQVGRLWGALVSSHGVLVLERPEYRLYAFTEGAHG